MNTSNLRTSSFFRIASIFFLILLVSKVNAQETIVEPCKECLTIHAVNPINKTLPISYDAKNTATGFLVNRSNLVEIWFFYKDGESQIELPSGNITDSTLITTLGNETIGVAEGGKTYDYDIGLSPYFGKKDLKIKVKEFKIKPGGGKGELYRETTEKVYDSVPLYSNTGDGAFIAARITDIQPNSCGGEKISLISGTATTADIKAATFRNRELHTFQKGERVQIDIHFISIFNKVTYSFPGPNGDAGEIDIKPSTNLPGFSYGFFFPYFPKLSFDKEYNHCYPIIIKFYQGGNQPAYTAVIPVLVVGEEIDLSKRKSTLSPPVPTMILHNPIGEGSKAFFTKGASSCSQVTMGLSDAQNANASLTVKVGVEGDVLGIPFEASASGGGNISNTNSTSNQTSTEVCITEVTDNELVIGEDEAPSYEGTVGDLFVGNTTEYYYGPSIKIEHTCTSISTISGVGLVVKKATPFAKFEFEIEEEIANLQKSLDNNPNLSDKHRLFLENNIEAWDSMVYLNKLYVAQHNNGTIYNLRKGHPQGHSKETKRTKSFSMETKLLMEDEVFTEVGVSLAGSGFSAGAGVKVSNEVSNGESQSSEYSNIIGFRLEGDNDEGDLIKVKVITDERFGSHIFKLVENGTISSCPYIGGKRRDVPHLSIGAERKTKDIISNVSVGDGSADKAFVKLNVCNYNETGESRDYYIRADKTRTAVIKESGELINNRGNLIRNIASGSCREIEITIDQENPNTFDYNSIVLQLTDKCSDVVGEEDITSEVVLDVHFKKTFQVHFQVDLTNEVIAPNGVFVTGDFQKNAGFPNNWNPTATPMTDANGDGVYEVRLTLTQVEFEQSFQYRFINGDNLELVPAACSINDNNGNLNRYFQAPDNSNSLSLPVVCFQTCSACEFIERVAVFPSEDSILVIPASGGSVNFTVTSNTDWTVQSNVPWFSISPENGSKNGSFMVSANENLDYNSLPGEIYITSVGGFFEKRTVVQLGVPQNCFIDFLDLQVSDCQDNGTPNDSSDDYYEYSLNPEGEPIGLTYSVFANGQLIKAGVRYGKTTIIDTVAANTDVGTITIKDGFYNGCQKQVTVIAPNCMVVQPPVVVNQPDYTVTSMSAPPTEVNPGQNIYMSAEISNTGTQEFTEETKAFYWLSKDAQLDTLTDVYLDEDNIDALAVGSINFDEEYFTIPENIASGVYYIIYQADALNQVVEKDENNNTASRQITVIGNQPVATTLTCDDFEQYHMTDFISTQSPVWTKWTNNSNDGIISNDKASNGQQSLKIAHDSLSAGQTDILARLGDLNTGTYELNWKMYIPQGKKGYFNSQKFQNEPGREFGFEIIFDANGKAKLRAGGLQGNFDYPQETWMDVSFIFDLDADEVTLKLNEKALFQWDISYTINNFGKTTQLGAINFYAIDHALFYIDEICLTDISANRVQSATSRSSVNSLSEVGLLTTQSTITDLEEAQLLQNYPNPVVHQTTIPLTIPTEFHTAQLIITCVDGRMMKEIMIKDTGRQQLLVSTNEWSEGIYFYSLILDNKLISTKRMVVIK